MEMWNSPIDKNNLKAFYNSTIDMVYPSVYSICKEPVRTESVIIKSYVDTYQQRNSISGEEVLFVFGDILLKNANAIVEKSPPPENIQVSQGNINEFTRNNIYEKITDKIESRSFKATEFFSSDSKKIKSIKDSRPLTFQLSVSPFLIIQLIVLALIIWGVSYLSITLPYRNNKLIPENEIPGTSQFKSISLKDEYVSILNYLPFNMVPVAPEEVTPPEENQDTELAPSIAETTEPEPSATKG